MHGDDPCDCPQIDEQAKLYIEPNLGVGNECAPPSDWDITVIAIAIVVLVFYGTLNWMEGNEWCQSRIRKMLGRPEPVEKEEEDDDIKQVCGRSHASFRNAPARCHGQRIAVAAALLSL